MMALRAASHANWNKRDFQSFIRGCENVGRTDYEGIAHEIIGKTAEDVKAYSATFWARYKEIEGAVFRLTGLS